VSAADTWLLLYYAEAVMPSVSLQVNQVLESLQHREFQPAPQQPATAGAGSAEDQQQRKLKLQRLVDGIPTEK